MNAAQNSSSIAFRSSDYEDDLINATELHNLRKARNKTAHGGAKADPKTSKRMIEQARSLIEPRIKDALM